MKKFFFLILFFTNYVYAGEKSISIEADKIKAYDNVIKASGNVIVEDNDKKMLTENLEYNKEEKIIYTKSKSKIKNDVGTFFFEEGKITSNFKKGNFKQSGIKFNKNINIFSNSLNKYNDDIFVANYTTYYVCPIDLDLDLEYSKMLDDIKKKKGNIFSITSKNVRIDNTKKRIYLKHSVIRFFDVPIFYLPYFYTSKPFVDMVSGFDTPYFESISDYGLGVYTPYIKYFNNKSKLVFTPVLYQYGSFAGKLDYKKTDHNGYINNNFIYLYDNNVSKNVENIYNITEKDEKKYKQNRFFLHNDGNYQFDNYKFLNFNINIASDEYIYRDYLQKYDNYLSSKLDFSIIDFNKFNYINFNLYGFQEIREDADIRQKTTPYLVPRIDTHLTSKNLIQNQNSSLFFELDNSVWSSNIFNINDNKYSRIHTNFNINYSTIKFNSNIQTNLNLFVDGFNKDKHFINNSNENLTLKNNNLRIIPEFSTDLRTLYYIFNSTNITIEPIVQYYISNKDYDYNKKFINEDSERSEINITNLFLGNRFNGLDRREYGTRLNYGFNLNYDSNHGNFVFKIGQAYREIDNYDMLGFDKNFSDILNGFGYFNNFFSIDYILNLDRKDFDFKSNNILLKFYLNKFTFYTTYIYARNINSDNHEIIEELENGLNYNFFKNWNISINLVHDLKNSNIEKINSSIYYNNNCFITGIKFSRKDYLHSDNDYSIKFYFSMEVF